MTTRTKVRRSILNEKAADRAIYKNRKAGLPASLFTKDLLKKIRNIIPRT